MWWRGDLGQEQPTMIPPHETSPAHAYALARREVILDLAALAERVEHLGDGRSAAWSDVRTLHHLQDLVLEARRVVIGMR
jgi:hypothetical protein